MSDAAYQPVPFAALMHRAGAFVPTLLQSLAAPAAPPEDDGYARGLADGQAMAASAFDADRMALQQLLAAAGEFQSEGNDELSALIGETVLRLVEQIVGKIEIDTGFLEWQIAKATALITEADAARTIWLNPVDYALLEQTDLSLEKKIDPQLPRGAMRIDCSESWIEHGAAIGLDKLRALLAAEGPGT
jgi:flagellar assembly protein FliH